MLVSISLPGLCARVLGPALQTLAAPCRPWQALAVVVQCNVCLNSRTLGGGGGVCSSVCRVEVCAPRCAGWRCHCSMAPHCLRPLMWKHLCNSSPYSPPPTSRTLMLSPFWNKILSMIIYDFQCCVSVVRLLVAYQVFCPRRRITKGGGELAGCQQVLGV